MKTVLNNLFILLLFLSPIVDGQDKMICRMENNHTVAMINCQDMTLYKSGHKLLQSQVSNEKINNCCDTGQCHCVLHTMVVPPLVAKESTHFVHVAYFLLFQQTVPFKAFQAPFRPPIS